MKAKVQVPFAVIIILCSGLSSILNVIFSFCFLATLEVAADALN